MLSTIYLFLASLFVQQPVAETNIEQPKIEVRNGGGGVIVPDKKKEN
ncbi:hypothetical protein [Pseudoalteromonas sp. MMG024]|nr:hypothetical protein [Pseudoalteromonas sp. MMG024]MCF6459102.1 hypothetical protein [Pseudoalteromonas sp. MMG024]